MAVVPRGQLGNGVSTSSGTAVNVTTTGPIAVDELVVIRVASDNLNATTPTFTGVNIAGLTWTTQRQGAVNASAAAGVAGAIITAKCTQVVNAGTIIQVNLSGAVAHKAMLVEAFSGVENTVRSTAVSATGASTAASSGASGTVNAGDLVLGVVANETRANLGGDTDTLNGAWSSVFQRASTASGSDTSAVAVLGQYKIPNAAGAQTFNITSTNSEWWAACVVLQATPEPTITQAAYQFFDDAGTESGAAALAALNTAVTGNLAAGDGYGQIRVRLQSTNATTIPATDDFKLQYEKNASGTWLDVIATGTEAVSAEYPESNRDSGGALGQGANDHYGQTNIVGDGKQLTQMWWYLQKVGSPTGTLRAALYLLDGAGGWHGTQVALSDPVDAAMTPAAYAWVFFIFDGSYTMVNGTQYGIAIISSFANQSANYVSVGSDATTPTAPGIQAFAAGAGAWGGVGGFDSIYRVFTADKVGTVIPFDSPTLTEGAATTNRLGAGTGTFTAGKVSEAGHVQNVGWAGNNYTEILYSVKLIAADLANGDTLRFRVLRNGSTTGMTYAVTPTINISLIVGPGPVALAGSSSGISTVTSALAPERGLAAITGVGVSTTTSALAVARPLAAAAAGLSTTTSALTVEKAHIALVGQADGVSTTTSTLARAVPMAATVGGLSTVTAATAVARALAAATGVGTSTTTSALAVARPLTASVTGLSTVTADLTVVKAPVGLAGQSGGVSTTTAALARAVPMVAAAAGVSTTTSATVVARALVGSAAGLSTTTAAPVVTRGLVGSTAGLATAISDIALVRGLAGSSAGLSTTVVALSSTADVFDPRVFTGLAVWLDASQIEAEDGAEISAWTDLSGQENIGWMVGTPLPVLKANTLASKPVVRFTVSEGRLRGACPTVTTNFTIAYIVRRWGPNVGRALTATYPGTAAFNFLVGFHTSSADWMYDNGNLNSPMGWVGDMITVPTAWRLYGADGTSTPSYVSRFFIDGVQTGVDWPSGQGLGGTYNLSGYGATGPEETMDCEVAELIIYDRKLSDAERQQVEGYLRDKWLYVPPPVEMAGSSNGTSTAGSTSLVFSRPLVVTAAGSSTAGATTLVRTLATTAAAGGLSTATGSLVLAKPVAASVAGASSATGTLAVARSLAATAAGVSTVTATAVGRAVPLAASATGVSTTTSAMATADALVANAGGVATVTGALAVARTLAASAAGVATTTANAVVSGAGGMSALVPGTSTVIGALRVARSLAGSSSGIAAAGGALAKIVPLVGGTPTPTLPVTTGLGIQLDASQLGLTDGAPVTVWSDLSVADHDLTPRFGTAPTLKTNVLNGLPVVRYNGTSDVLTASAIGSYKHFFLVAKYNHATFDNYDGLLTDATGDLVFVGNGAGSTQWYAPGAGTYHYNGVDATGAYTAPMTVWAHMGISRSSPWNYFLQIGLDRTHPPRYWDGDVAEVIAYDRVLSDPERQQVEQYLNAKWFVASGGSAAIGVSTTISAVVVARRLVASSTGVATATASLSVVVSMTATSGGKMASTAALARAVPMTAAVSGLSTASGATVAVGRAMVAATNGSSTATAAGVRVAYAMIASADGTSTATADVPAIALQMMGSSNGISAAAGELGLVEQLFGMWNGQYFDAMQYGPYTVVDFMLTPPA